MWQFAYMIIDSVVYGVSYMLPNSTLIPARKNLEQVHHVHLGINLYCRRNDLNTLKEYTTQRSFYPCWSIIIVNINVSIFPHKNNVNTFVVGSTSVILCVMSCINNLLSPLYIDHILWLHVHFRDTLIWWYPP
jgi:hypothetical protein